jgi:sulfopyruvate decarboxylase TPP-binding subunit
MRGEFAEFNPWQVPMGSKTEAALQLCDFLTYRVDLPEDVEDIVDAGAEMAFAGNLPVAILLGQRLIGRKKWVR